MHLRGLITAQTLHIVTQDPFGGSGAQVGLPLRHGVQRQGQLSGRSVFEQVPTGTHLQCLPHILFVLVHGEHQHADCGPLAGNLGSGLQAVEAGHGNVHQHQIGLEPLHHRNHCKTVGGFAHDSDLRHRFEQHTYTGTHQGVVISEHNFEFHNMEGGEASNAQVNRTVQPLPGAETILTCPPTADARSRIPSRPRL